jgi:hypothetical protein
MSGIAFLDKNVAGWRSKINIGSLNIQTDCGCVVGQIFGSFNDKREQMFGTYAGAANRGFYAYNHLNDGANDEYRLLTAEWKRVLQAEQTVRRSLMAHLSGLAARRAVA